MKKFLLIALSNIGVCSISYADLSLARSIYCSGNFGAIDVRLERSEQLSGRFIGEATANFSNVKFSSCQESQEAEQDRVICTGKWSGANAEKAEFVMLLGSDGVYRASLVIPKKLGNQIYIGCLPSASSLPR